MRRAIKAKYSFWVSIALLFSLSGCAVNYVAAYDEAVKEEIFRVAKQVDLFWGALLDVKAYERDYEKFKEQYNRIEADIRALVMKNEVRALNKESTRQANIALTLWVEDRAIHRAEDSFSDFEARRHREDFNRVFTAMVKGEEAKNTSGTADNEDENGEGQ